MTNTMRFEYHLGSVDNFESWKLRLMMLLKENKLESFVREDKEEPKDDPEKSEWIEKNEKAMKIIVDAVQDHTVPIVAKHTTTYRMFRALENAFIINNTNRKLALKRQMNNVSMNKGETINAFFMRVTDLRDQLSALGYEIENQELSLIALGGLPNSWESFVQGISARSKIPKLDHLRSDCLHEESRLMIKGKHKTLDEDVQVLNTNAHKKGKKKNNKRKINFYGKGQSKQKKDLSKIQCFRCDLYGHYAINCPDRSKPQASFAKSEKSNEAMNMRNMPSIQHYPARY